MTGKREGRTRRREGRTRREGMTRRREGSTRMREGRTKQIATDKNNINKLGAHRSSRNSLGKLKQSERVPG